jgi:hypothetical protein
MVTNKDSIVAKNANVFRSKMRYVVWRKLEHVPSLPFLRPGLA